jgi:hypothetical protein
VKELWLKEVAHMHKLVTQMQKAHSSYVRCQQEWEQVREDSLKIDQCPQGKLDKRKTTNDEAVQKVWTPIVLTSGTVTEILRYTVHCCRQQSLTLYLF